MEENSPVIADPIAECGALEQYLGVWDTCSVVNSAIMGESLLTTVSLGMRRLMHNFVEHDILSF